MHQRSEMLNDLFQALALAQGEFKAAVMDTRNPHFNSKFASLNAIQDVYRKPFATHGLSLLQTVESVEDRFEIETILAHKSGQFISSRFRLLVDKQSMQGLGSAVTYARRYAVSSMLGIVSDEDDDGNEATKNAPVKRAWAPPKEAMNKVQVSSQGTISASKLAQAMSTASSDGPTRTTTEIEEHLKDLSAPIKDGELLKAGEYRIEFGKDQGKMLQELGPSYVQSKLDWIEKEATKPLGRKMETFVDYAKMFLEAQ